MNIIELLKYPESKILEFKRVEELKRFSQNKTFDETPMPELGAEQINFEVASEHFNKIKLLTKKDLETLELVINYQGHKVPTVAGMLLFGHDRAKYFPQAWIQAGRFRGTNKTDIIDSTKIHTYPTIAIEEALRFIEKHAMQSLQIGRTTHQKVWNIPLKAIREAIINAVVHADYSQKGSPLRIAIFDDRIEIENPGLLPFGLTITDIKQGISKLRNRIIGRVFHTVGLIEQWGSGIQRIIHTTMEGGFPEPEFQELATHFRVTIYTAPTKPAMTDEVNQSILHVLKSHHQQGLSTHEIAKHIQLSTRATRNRLLKLIELGMVIEVASSAQDPNRLYFLAGA